jgi:hypothetical protein
MSGGALVSGVRIEVEHLCPVEPLKLVQIGRSRVDGFAGYGDVCWYICWYLPLRSLEKCHPINMVGSYFDSRSRSHRISKSICRI